VLRRVHRRFPVAVFFLLESVLHIIKKKAEEVAIVSVEKPAGYLVALVSLCSFFFLLLVLFLPFVSSNCQYVLALLFNFASLLDCAILLRRVAFVSPGNRCVNLSQVLLVCVLIALCAW
jgi:hypothetical protein